MQLPLAEGLTEVDGRLVYVERLTRDVLFMTYISRVLFSGRSDYQLIEVVENPTFGKMLYLDHKLQVATADEWIYHEALVHPAMLTHPEPRRVLIVGGGDGGALREVLKHDCVEEVTVVELDPRVVECVREYLPEVPRGAFDDSRVRFVFTDGRRFIEEGGGRFDVIIADVTDPWGQSSFLYTREFYEAVSRRLSELGVFVTQALSVYLYFDQFARIYNAVSTAFKHAVAYSAFVPSFSDQWSFVMGSNSVDPSSVSVSEVERRYRERGLVTRYYRPERHRELTSLPAHVEARLREFKEVSTDSSPVAVPL
ncbi:MAG: spermidine synthase [Thermoprotei archaeon]|nr:MAG: spermidine synthase [Thermoprotei archaeon]